MKQVPVNITDVETIGSRTKARREELDLTQVGLAARAGVSPGTIGNFESGIRESPRQLLEIAAALGVTPEWLKTGRLPKLATTGTSTLPALTGSGSGGPATAPVTLRAAIHALAKALEGHDDMDREAAAIFLRKLTMNPGLADEVADKLDGLLGGGGASQPMFSRKSA